MCGRYRLARKKEILEEYFGTTESEEAWEPRYNIAPTQLVPVVRKDPKEPLRDLSLIRWGLVPSWAEDLSIGARMINARSETASTRPAFRDALKSRRCLVPADGFYEWQRTGKTKQPYCLEVNDGELFAFAGIWDRWRDPNGKVIQTCSILTTTPNSVAAAIHDRMPVILDSHAYDLWLDPELTNVDAVCDLLKPFQGLMRWYPVSTKLNQVKNDDAECARRAEPSVIQGHLLFGS